MAIHLCLLIIISFKNVVTVKMNIGKLVITSCSELSNILRVKVFRDGAVDPP